MSTTRLRKYIREQPRKPKGTRNRVPILVSDSKGHTLRDYCPDYNFPFEHWCKSGARTKELVDIIKDRTPKALERHNKILIYLWAGTCDITYKKGKEIRLRSKNNTTINRIIKELKYISKHLEKFGSKVILKIVDLPISSIEKWNTKHLRHQHISPKSIDTYKAEDKLLTTQLRELNRHIWLLNKSSGHEPIKVSQFYFRTRGGRKKSKLGSNKTRHTVRTYLNKRDGVHPGKIISLVITKLLLLDSYKECYVSLPSEDILQIRVEEEELLQLTFN